jgi:hypothetical protein
MTIAIHKLCINEALVVFVDAYKSGGAVNVGVSKKCK